jgi:hypothetical protein
MSSVTLLAAGALAQSARDETVLGRPRADYSPIGIELAGGGFFTVYPKVTIGVLFDDNVYREEHNPNSDLAVLIQPEVRVDSDWDTHALGFGAVATIVRYRDETSADYEDLSLSANGRADISEDFAASGFLEWARLHEDRGDPNSAAANQDSIEFNRFIRRLALDYQGSPVFGRVSGEWATLDYHDENGVNLDDRDYDFYETRLRVGTEITPSVSLFVEPGYNWRVYDGLDDFGFDRDSQGYDVHVGATYDVTAVTFLEVFGGYYRQEYDDPRFGTGEGLAMGVEAIWNPNDITTVTGRISRTLRETSIQNTSAIRDTGVDLRVDYEVLENLVASAHGSVHGEHFHGTGRDDDLRTYGVGLTYFVNPYLQTGLDYTFGERNSHVDGEGYRYNAILVRLTGAI